MAGACVVPAARSAVADDGCPTTGGCVDVHQYQDGTDTVVQQFTPAQLEQDSDIPNNTCYDEQVEANGKVKPDGTFCVSNALSVHGLLAQSGFDLSNDQLHTAVVRNDGTWATLSTPELQDPPAAGAFKDSQLPAVYSTGNSVGYVRPLRSSSDTNVQDIFTPNDQSSPLNIYVFTGPTLTVTTTASPRHHVKVGQAVSFGGTVGGSSDPSSLQYSWSFGDGHGASTLGTSHAFTAPGSYPVLLKVIGAGDNSGGISEPLTINVGAASTKSPGPGGATHTPSPTPSASASGTPAPTTHSSPGPGVRHRRHAKFPGLGQLALGPSIATRLGARLSGQQPLIANGGADQFAYVSGQLVGAGQPVSLSAAASESSTVSDSALSATAESTSWGPGVVPIYVGAVLLLLGVGIARERGWLTLRRR
ncbi:MAG TPA: PKD domain-containing protein [Mycobacteriales bacterium]|nr:PKD domain-containing protein [Mycobacteriales bacterium]